MQIKLSTKVDLYIINTLIEYRSVLRAIFRCYLHTECPLGPASILKVMPTDDDIDQIYNKLTNREKLSSDIPKWGDAVVWSDLHHIDKSYDKFRYDWG